MAHLPGCPLDPKNTGFKPADAEIGLNHLNRGRENLNRPLNMQRGQDVPHGKRRNFLPAKHQDVPTVNGRKRGQFEKCLCMEQQGLRAAIMFNERERLKAQQWARDQPLFMEQRLKAKVPAEHRFGMPPVRAQVHARNTTWGSVGKEETSKSSRPKPPKAKPCPRIDSYDEDTFVERPPRPEPSKDKKSRRRTYPDADDTLTGRSLRSKPSKKKTSRASQEEKEEEEEEEMKNVDAEESPYAKAILGTLAAAGVLYLTHRLLRSKSRRASKSTEY